MTKNKQHPYAEILRAIADGKQVQFNGAAGWEDKDQLYVMTEICRECFEPRHYRIKPKTIRIGEYDVPEPLWAAPEIGTEYFIASLNDDDLCICDTWDDVPYENQQLANGLAHATEEAAIMHAKALISLTAQK